MISLTGSTDDRLEAVFNLVMKNDRKHTLAIRSAEIALRGNRSTLEITGEYTAKGAWESDLTRRFVRACAKIGCGARVRLEYFR